MKKKIIFFILIAMMTLRVAHSQEVVFRASAKQTVQVGEKFSLVYSVNAEGKSFKGPSIKDFNVLSGPYTSSSSNIQIINGRMNQSVEYSFSYVLSAFKEGTFEIPAAEINIKGSVYKSNAIKITVVKGNASSGQNQQGQNNKKDKQSGNVSSEDVFIKAVANKKSPLLGEQLIVTYKLYTRLPISDMSISKLSNFNGFWSKDLLKDNDKLRQYKEYVDGEEFIVAEIRQVALFPLKSGNLQIDPLEMDCMAKVKQQKQKRSGDPFFDSFFNDPFFDSYNSVKVKLKSNAITINVKPLPSSKKPADFSGGVGNFSMKTDIDRKKVKANEPINLKFTISGWGNIELVENPAINFPPDFEVYDPKISSNISTAKNLISGSRVIEYLIIPRTHGDYKIPPAKLSYYDLDKKTYITLTAPEFSIHVDKGDGTSSSVSYSGVNQEDVKYIGSDIRHIRLNPGNFQPMGFMFFNSAWFYILLVLPLVAFVVFILTWKKELEKRSNISLMRNRKATKVAQKRLKNASALLQENKQEEFYVEISQALWGYLSDKFNIPLSSLSMETVSQVLNNQNVKPEIIEEYISTLNNCEFARFAPGEKTASMRDIFQEALNLISKTERELI